MLKRAKLFIVRGGVLLLLGITTYCVLPIIWDVFSEATDTVKAAAIAAFVGVFTLLVGRIFEQERERKSRINIEKIKVYERFFDFYFSAMGNSVVIDKPNEPRWMAKEIYTFQKELVLWGSDAVIDAYARFRRILNDFSATTIEDEELAVKLAPAIAAAALVLKRMRQDIGYSFTSFSAEDLGLFQLKQDDPHYDKLMEELGKL
ncbi:hypothetical protein [Lentibacter sp. XHP0401]|uniref:hypothetical protein n=1 Tax=Lentibacter sp. XHP0401 TaxID=2984334 RepID=UPI0021E7B656|nr:hypothetical protein [Lentibacter sp. XHP0401]MCV2893507.1 hypothetical protein [Lentibacter sp. XHP0401]